MIMKSNKIFSIYILLAIVNANFSAAKDELVAIRKIEGVTCYIQPFLSSKTNNFCFGMLGIFGTTTLASGSIWGNLTTLHHMGSVQYRGTKGKCEAKASNEHLKGTLWVNDGILDG